MTFLRLATPSQILIFSNLILHNFILVSKSNSSVSKLFIFIRIRCVLNLHPNLRQYQIHNVVQNSESQPKDLYFSKGIFSGLIFCATYNRTFEFSNVKIEKRISQRVRSYYSYKLRLLHELRDKNFSHLSKDKENKKQFTLQFALKFVINTCFDEESRGSALHFVEILSKSE